jgi:signal transduction histidine kinase
LPEQVEIAAYYGVSEALTNTAKHAAAALVQIQVDTVQGRPGWHPRARGTGLRGLKDRVEALGGRILLDSPPDAGTTLRLELPLTDANDGGTFR